MFKICKTTVHVYVLKQPKIKMHTLYRDFFVLAITILEISM